MGKKLRLTEERERERETDFVVQNTKSKSTNIQNQTRVGEMFEIDFVKGVRFKLEKSSFQ